MKNVALTILTAVVAVLAIAGLILYPQYGDMQKALQDCEKKFSELKAKASVPDSQVGQLKSTYDTLINDLKDQIQKQEVTIKSFHDGLSLTFVDRILFDFGKATLTPDGEKVLQKVGGVLKSIKDQKIQIIGHADDRPILKEYQHLFASNWELSAARAATVVRFFQEKAALDPTGMEAVGRSFYQPIAGNDTAKGRAQNRRVEILIAPKMGVKEKEAAEKEVKKEEVKKEEVKKEEVKKEQVKEKEVKGKEVKKEEEKKEEPKKK